VIAQILVHSNTFINFIHLKYSMNALLIIVAVVIFLFCIMIIFAIIKKLLKIAFIAAVIFVIIFLITNGAIMNDVTKIKNAFISENTLILLDNSNTILAGFVDGEKAKLVDQTTLIEINNEYSQGNLANLKKDYYKVIIVKTKVIEKLENITINNKPIYNVEILAALVKDTTISSITYTDLVTNTNIEGIKNTKAALFAYIYRTNIKPTLHPIVFFTNFKQNNIIVYPETIFFKFAKFMPLLWIEQKINIVKDRIETQIA